MKPMSITRRLLCAVAAFICSTMAAAQGVYPQKPITIVVPFGAGSGTDTLARNVAKGLAIKLGQPVTVDNKAGAGGIIGASQVARSSPDGYTLLLATSGPMAANASLYGKLAYDPEADFEPVALIGKQPMLVIGSKEAKAKRFDEIVAEAKANPRAVNFGASNTTSRVFVELLKKSAGLSVETVLYKDVASMMTDLISGRISYSFENAGASLPHINGGRVNFIAVAAPKRAAFATAAPATGEYGFDEHGLLTWYAVFAPRGTPAQVVEKLNTAVNEILRSADFESQSRSIGLELTPGSPADLKRYQAAEIKNWRKLVDATGVKIE